METKDSQKAAHGNAMPRVRRGIVAILVVAILALSMTSCISFGSGVFETKITDAKTLTDESKIASLTTIFFCDDQYPITPDNVEMVPPKGYRFVMLQFKVDNPDADYTIDLSKAIFVTTDIGRQMKPALARQYLKNSLDFLKVPVAEQNDDGELLITIKKGTGTKLEVYFPVKLNQKADVYEMFGVVQSIPVPKTVK